MHRSVIRHPPGGKRCSLEIDIPPHGSIACLGPRTTAWAAHAGRCPLPNLSWVGDQFIGCFLFNYLKPLWKTQANPDRVSRMCVCVCVFTASASPCQLNWPKLSSNAAKFGEWYTVDHRCQTLPNVAHSVIVFGPRRNTKWLLDTTKVRIHTSHQSVAEMQQLLAYRLSRKPTKTDKMKVFLFK